MPYVVILKSLTTEGERITLSQPWTNRANAEESRKQWRRVLGGNKYWTIERRPGLDTFNNLGLKIEKVD